MKIAANLSLLFTELPLLERIAAAAAAGFDGVEVQFPYDMPAALFKEELERCGMPLVLINLPAGDLMHEGVGLAAVPERQRQFDEALDQALSYAAIARPFSVNVLPGRLADNTSRAAALDVLVVNLRKAAEAFEPLDIKVLFEAINPLDMPGFLINTPEHLREVLRRVAHSNCWAQLDLYHMARQGISLSKAINLLKGKIGHVQFADCPGRGAPGTGQLDILSTVSLLPEWCSDIWLGAEFIPQGATENNLRWLQEWRAKLPGCE